MFYICEYTSLPLPELVNGTGIKSFEHQIRFLLASGALTVARGVSIYASPLSDCLDCGTAGKCCDFYGVGSMAPPQQCHSISLQSYASGGQAVAMHTFILIFIVCSYNHWIIYLYPTWLEVVCSKVKTWPACSEKDASAKRSIGTKVGHHHSFACSTMTEYCDHGFLPKSI